MTTGGGHPSNSALTTNAAKSKRKSVCGLSHHHALVTHHATLPSHHRLSLQHSAKQKVKKKTARLQQLLTQKTEFYTKDVNFSVNKLSFFLFVTILFYF